MMNEQQVLSELEEIFRSVFDDPGLTLTRATCAEDIEDWDSLEQITLLMLIGKHYDLKFSIDDVSGLQNVGDMVDLVLRRKGAR